MRKQIFSVLPGDHPWQNHLICHDTVTSTNDIAKHLASNGAPEGTVVVASCQTAGRGRLGRSFHAPEGMGVYLSLLLRPNCTPDEIMHLTCATAVAMCNAVERATSLRPQIKWTNDLVVTGRKVGGILTEISVNTTSGKVDWVIVGIGINCLQQGSDFPAELQSIACSLLQCTGKAVSPGHLAGYMTDELYRMRQILLTEKAAILQAYRNDCMTVGKEVVLLRGEEKRYGTALDIDADGGLIVQFIDGSIQTVQSGEISVRGLYGYA